jgi:hypothetical protein
LWNSNCRFSFWWFRIPPPSCTGATEEYDGNSWTNSTSLNTARTALAGAGIQTAGLAFGGETPGGAQGATEEYDGTSWTNSNSLNTARYV